MTTLNTNLVTQISAQSGGSEDINGSNKIIARGVCWNTESGASVDLISKTIDGSGVGSFTSELNGLSANTKYYVRAYATDSIGTVYGNEITFTTLGCQAPSNLNVTNLTDYSATLQWSPVPGTSTYKVYVVNQSGFTSWKQKYFTTSSTSIDIDGLVMYDWYYFQVKTDCSDYSGLKSFMPN